ncbi:MAG: NAD(P)-binding domain-containing protein, partial [Gammaproteobacteria bacterium]|nr:NAD(P)-binding domain-containing protein [Gammaproteobacteria bacterium]
MLEKKIVLIGAGNMATALVSGLINNGYPAKNISITDHNEKKLAALQQQFSLETYQDNSKAATFADIIILAVKPQATQQAVMEIKQTVKKKKPLIVSIAAGITSSQLMQWFATELPLIRCMPNTPALIGCGVTGIFANSYVTKQQKQIIGMIFS